MAEFSVYFEPLIDLGMEDDRWTVGWRWSMVMKWGLEPGESQEFGVWDREELFVDG